MASEYDKIQTPKELVDYVSVHGLITNTEDLNRAADIFCTAPIDELVMLANDIGRNNEKGEPDPDCSWSSSRRATRDTFYFILSHIWGWESLTRFWNEHTNPEHKKLAELKDKNESLCEELKTVTQQSIEEHKMRIAETEEKLNYKAKAEKLEAELHDKEIEIIELKAKLYDMITTKGLK